MANFEQAIVRPLANEGLYDNNPNDPGGETFKGIARRSHPGWAGWARIDQYKTADPFPAVLEHDKVLHQNVLRLYKAEYWDKVRGDTIESQDIAAELLDMSVHMGVRRAVMFLQRSLNALNRRATLWPDIVVDGDMGTMTERALSKYEALEAPNFLLKALVFQRGAYYVERVLEHEMSEDFLRGWLRRIVVQR